MFSDICAIIIINGSYFSALGLAHLEEEWTWSVLLLILIIGIRLSGLFFNSLDFDCFFIRYVDLCICLRASVIKGSTNQIFMYLTKIHLSQRNL